MSLINKVLQSGLGIVPLINGGYHLEVLNPLREHTGSEKGSGVIRGRLEADAAVVAVVSSSDILVHSSGLGQNHQFTPGHNPADYASVMSHFNHSLYSLVRLIVNRIRQIYIYILKLCTELNIKTHRSQTTIYGHTRGLNVLEGLVVT